MLISTSAIDSQLSLYSSLSSQTTATEQEGNTTSVPTDVVSFGNSTVTESDAMNMVVERAYEKLRSVVSDAAEAVGITDLSSLDTSAEATAGRIADFALGAFSAWRENHAELEEDEARQAFVDFIGGAINQGIEEAREILTALQALSDDVDSMISSVSELVWERLNDFAANGQ